ncbi:PK beta-barrel-protein domain-containing protein-like protein [Hyaloscypha hepaticicola]|uniref:PK beta-barrel-protein domain-containing protein-like protein n=1 Tax=Hyaloscypha hepaticicola TaxID=2082293 RepID=A0A2J6Q4U5_9HELO|nr:PK beta-barrel-protein domain-containing protein-like protein [Hyaloscypha hepaticicola]
MATNIALHENPDTSKPSRTVLQVRTGKKRPVFGLPNASGIFKIPHPIAVRVSFLGCDGDERGFTGHGGVDKALMWYPSQHYTLWQAELPQNSSLFTVGGFGENIATQSEELSEEVVCVGDIYKFGAEGGVVLQISEPRQPCFMLNHRFEVKDMSLRSQNANRTGWYCRVLEEGNIQAGDSISLIERMHPKWTIKEVQKVLYVDRKNWEAIKELSKMAVLGEEIRTILSNRLKKGVFLDESDRLVCGEDNSWNEYRLASRKLETERICTFEFEAVSPNESPGRAVAGSHVRVKLGEHGKLVRAYSVVAGNKNAFKVGIALDENSRGGSKHLHEKLKIGDTLIFSQIKTDFPLATDADQHILIAGGIGITAFLITAFYLKEKGLNYHLYYAVRSSQDVAFKSYLRELGNNVTIRNKSKNQRLDISDIIRKASTRTHIYACGPPRLMDGVKVAARTLGFPFSNIHFEAFTARTSGDSFVAELAESKKEIEVKEEQTLLDVLRDAGFDVPSSCEVGNCGTCRVGIRSGRVEHRGTGLLEGEKKGAMLSCVSRGIGRIVLDM